MRRIHAMWKWERASVALALLCCSNVFLISQRLAIQSGQGQNLISIRDLSLGAFMLLALPSVARMKAERWMEPTVLVTLLLLMLSVPLGILGLVEGNDLRQVMAEINCLMGWAAGICLLAVVQRMSAVKYILNVVSILGAFIAVGVFIELFFRVPFVTGGTGQATIKEGGVIMRSTPSCWPLLCASMAILGARAAGDRGLGRFRRCLVIGIVGVEIIACFATLSRTLLIAFVASSVAIAVGLGKKGMWVGVLAAVLLIGAWFGSIVIGDGAMGEKYSATLQERYSVFSDKERAEEYNTSELRPQQMRAFVKGIGPWLLLGSGLGSELWTVNDEFATTTKSSDVSMIQFGTRYGLWGLLFLVTLGYEGVSGIRSAKRTRGGVRWVVLGIASAQCGLWSAGMFGNIWALPQTAAPTMMLFCLSAGIRPLLVGNRERTRPLRDAREMHAWQRDGRQENQRLAWRDGFNH